MTRRLPILVLALFLAIAMGLLWRSLSQPTTTDLDETLGEVDSEVATTDTEQAAALPRAPRAAPTPDVNERISAAPTAERPTTKDVGNIPESSLWVTGRLIFPDKVPLDESFTVVARGRRFGKDRKAPRQHRVEPDNAGRFRIAFAEKTSTGFIGLEARYMYLLARVRVKPKKIASESQGTPNVELRPLLGGVLRGIVAPPSGHEVSAETFDGVKVMMRDWRGDQPITKTSDVAADGSYEILGMPPSSGYNLTLQAEKFAGEDHADVGILAGSVTELDLALTLGVHLSGRILDAQGEPLQGAVANLMVTHPANGGMSTRAENTTTDEEGTFRFEGVHPGELTLTLRAEGATELVDSLGTLESGERREALLYTLAGGASVTGVAHWPDGKPASGISIQARPVEADGEFDWNSRKYEAQTEEDGSFVLEGLDERLLVIDASGRRERSDPDPEGSTRRKRRGPTLSARAEDIKPGTHGVQLLLSKGEVLVGSVRFARGGAPASFLIRASPDWQDMNTLTWQDSVERTFKPTDGEFELAGLKPGSWRVTARGKDFAETKETVIRIPHEGRLDLVVSPAASIRGRVVTPGGEPVGGAEITRVDVEGMNRSWSNNGSKTNSNGEFTMKSVEPGDYELRAEAPGWAPNSKFPLTLEAGESREGVVLVLSHSARLTGVLLPGAGEVANRTIAVWGTGGGAYESTSSDAKGRFVFDTLGAGTYTVQLQPGPGGDEDWQVNQANSPSVEVELLSGGTAHVELGGGPKHPIRIHGQVTAGGKPVAGCILHFNDGTRDNNAAVRSDEVGGYSVDVDGPGTYSVTIRPAGVEFGVNYNVFSVTVGDVTERRRDFELPTARVEVTLLRADGTPAAGAIVGLKALDVPGLEDNVSNDQAADDQGRFVFQHLLPGTYLLGAGGSLPWQEDGGDLARQFQEKRITLGAVEKVSLRLEEGAHISGRATYTDGAPAVQLNVRAYDSANRELTLRWNSTDGDGRFTLAGLPAGTLRVQVGNPGQVSGENTVHVNSGGEAHVDVSVAR